MASCDPLPGEGDEGQSEKHPAPAQVDQEALPVEPAEPQAQGQPVRFRSGIDAPLHVPMKRWYLWLRASLTAAVASRRGLEAWLAETAWNVFCLISTGAGIELAIDRYYPHGSSHTVVEEAPIWFFNGGGAVVAIDALLRALGIFGVPTPMEALRKLREWWVSCKVDERD